MLGVLVLATLTACGPPVKSSDEPSGAAETTQDESEPGLAGTEWVLALLGDREIPDGVEITLKVEDDPPYTKFNGNAVCNIYGGRNVATEDGVVEINTFESSAVGCGIDGNRLERDYYDALRDAAAYRMREGRLKMRDAAGETILVYTEQGREPGLPESGGERPSETSLSKE